MVKKSRSKINNKTLVIGIVAGAVMIMASIPLYSWQKMGQQRAESLANLHRVVYGALLYAQDWDGRLMVPARKLPDSSWETWPDLLKAYVTDPASFDNPSNSVFSTGHKLIHPTLHYEINTSYAMNRRFWDTFGPGPFPMDNLETSGQTALFVEAGPMQRKPREIETDARKVSSAAIIDYGDTADIIQNRFPYPSTHYGKMVVAAADGHVSLTKVAHYSSHDGMHDPLLGRIGNGIYNWNGGHANGETERPAHE